jgi:hypothetical protein
MGFGGFNSYTLLRSDTFFPRSRSEQAECRANPFGLPFLLSHVALWRPVKNSTRIVLITRKRTSMRCSAASWRPYSRFCYSPRALTCLCLLTCFEREPN